jgi:hypothetical protein
LKSLECRPPPVYFFQENGSPSRESELEFFAGRLLGDLRNVQSVVGNGERKGSSKKSRRWSKAWNIWGLINRRGGNNKGRTRIKGSKGPNGVERGWVRGLAVRVWDRKRVGGGREREKNNFLKVKNIILMI